MMTVNDLKQKMIKKIDQYLEGSNLTSTDFYNLVIVLNKIDNSEANEMRILCQELFKMNKEITNERV